MPLTSEAQWSVGLSVAGQQVQDVFDSFDGGNVVATSGSYRAGGMATPEAWVDPPTVEDIDISRAWRGERDAAIEKYLIGKIGHDCVVARQALNPNRTLVPGGLTTYRGKIAAVRSPTHDSMGNAVGRLTVTIAVDGLPS